MAERGSRRGLWMWAAAVVVGLVIGLAIGIPMGNPVLGLGVGIAIGVAFGLAFGAARKDLDGGDPPDPGGPTP